ncbi:HAMP domain-containing protein [Chloroflexia bacterium SDU3-3]|nr:HAMP domain-containing protein [Chloroflexia bacterium SDU3-3]
MSLRQRLTISYISFFAAALIVLDIGLYLLVCQAMMSSVDNELRLGAQLVQQDFTTSNESFQVYYGPRRLLPPPSISDFGGTNLFVQIYRQDGERVALSSNMPESLVPDLELDSKSFQAAMGNTAVAHTALHGTVRMREWVMPLTFRGEVVGVIQVVRSMREIDEVLQLFAYSLLGGGLIVLIAAARGGAWLTSAAFMPINEIADTTQSIVRAEDLTRRVPVPVAQDELHRLTLTINDMLARLDQQFQAQRRFIADVSHELRTPLAAMRGNIEVLDRGAARDPALLSESLADMRSEVNRLIRLVNDLLLLAQSESGLEMRHEPVELDTLLLEVHRELRPLALGVTLRLGSEDQVSVMGDRDRLKQALLNLAVNAIQHTPSGGSVTLNLASQGEFAAISVVDTGYGIAPEDLPHIFERFYRADQARTRVRGGAGLGLSLVHWIADAHGGTVSVESTMGAGSTFTLRIPRIPTPLAIVVDDEAEI